MPATTHTDLPLFPLGTVLFPQGLLPLQIFEVRYLDMVGRCKREGTPFGVISLVQGSEVEKPGQGHDAQEVFQAVGTLAHITEFTAPMSGLMQIKCTGGSRFKVLKQRRLPHGLWVADVSEMDPDQPLEIPQDLQESAQKLGSLIRTLQTRGVTAEQMPISMPYELEDCGWVANRWAELLPVPQSVKQDLLELENPLLRLELISDILDRTQLSF